jgi:hypothetical protein
MPDAAAIERIERRLCDEVFLPELEARYGSVRTQRDFVRGLALAARLLPRAHEMAVEIERLVSEPPSPDELGAVL